MKKSAVIKSEALRNIVAQISSGELVFPANVRATLKIQEALDEPKYGTDEIAKLIIQEPLVAARVIAVANSVAYSRFGGGITNVRMAISILGFSTLRSVVAAVIMRQICLAISDNAIREKMEYLWVHSATVAAMAHLLARKVSKIDPETALFAGVVHEVGGFYLLSRAEEFPALLESGTEIDYPPADQSHELEIARAVLQKLLIPKRVMSSIESCWHGAAVFPPVSLGDTLLLANHLTDPVSPLTQRHQTKLTANTGKIDFMVGDKSLQEILDESKEDLDSLTEALIH